MLLTQRIADWLAAHPGEPQGVAELAAAIPETTAADIARTCVLMRMQGVLGRNGAGTATSPYRFYLKRAKAP